MLCYSKVLKNLHFLNFLVVGGRKFKISPRAPTEPGPALLQSNQTTENGAKQHFGGKWCLCKWPKKTICDGPTAGRNDDPETQRENPSLAVCEYANFRQLDPRFKVLGFLSPMRLLRD